MGSLWWLGDESIRFGTVPLSLTGICSSSIWSRHPPSMRIVGVPACQISVSFYTSFFGGNCAIKPKETTFFGKSARSCEKKTLINTLLFGPWHAKPDVNVTVTVAYVIAASIPQYSQMLVFIRLSGLKMVAVCTQFACTSWFDTGKSH